MEREKGNEGNVCAAHGNINCLICFQKDKDKRKFWEDTIGEMIKREEEKEARLRRWRPEPKHRRKNIYKRRERS